MKSQKTAPVVQQQNVAVAAAAPMVAQVQPQTVMATMVAPAPTASVVMMAPQQQQMMPVQQQQMMPMQQQQMMPMQQQQMMPVQQQQMMPVQQQQMMPAQQQQMMPVQQQQMMPAQQQQMMPAQQQQPLVDFRGAQQQQAVQPASMAPPTY